MARKCEICGKGPIVGHKISHAHNVSKRRWLPNLKKVRVKIKGTPQRINICTQCIRSGVLEEIGTK